MTTGTTTTGPTTATVRPQKPWRTAVAAGMVSYLDSGALISTGIAFVLYADTLGIGPGTIGALQGLLTFALAVGALLGGRLGDRYGRRRVFTVTILVFLVGVVLLGAAVAPVMLFVGVVVVGLSVGADLPVSLSLINEEAPEGKKGRMIAFSVLLWNVGIIVPNVLTSALGGLGAVAGRVLFAQLVVVGIAVLVLRLFIRESAEWRVARQAEVEDPERIRFDRLPQLFRPPLRRTVGGLALYYTLWGLGANTITAFGTLIFVEVAHGTARTWASVSIPLGPIAVLGSLTFLAVADRRSRRSWVAAGGVLFVVAWTLPLVLGLSTGALIATLVIFVLSAQFSGEAIYKVWLQEMVPTLLRSTAQGLTITVQRVVGGLAAFVTPVLAIGHPQVFFSLLAAAAVASLLIGLLWVGRLPRARELEAPLVVVSEDGAATDAEAGYAPTRPLPTG